MKLSVQEEIQNYSCIVRKGDDERTFIRRGVIDLYELLRDDAEFMKGSVVIDKVIGKGAAALMALGRVGEVRTPLISEPALSLLQHAGVRVVYEKVVPYIINRTRTGMCPLEQRCAVSNLPEELLPVITRFIEEMKNQSINK